MCVCPSVHVSDFVRTLSSEPLNRLTKFGIVVYYHENECHAEMLVYYLQCQGHNEGL